MNTCDIFNIFLKNKIYLHLLRLINSKERFEILTAVSLKIRVFCVVTLWRLLNNLKSYDLWVFPFVFMEI